MSKAIEIEFKSMLSETEYQRLVSFYSLSNTQFDRQTNLYFDTEKSALKAQNSGLRIRYFNDRAEATLKIPQAVGLLEISDTLPFALVQKTLDTHLFPKEAVTIITKLRKKNILPEDLRLIGRLVTKRAEIFLPEGTLALDENWYAQHHDFELELEVQDSGKTKADFLALLDRLDLPYRPAENKIVRALSARYDAPENT